MKSDHRDVAFEELVNFLKRKKAASNEIKEEEGAKKTEVQEAKRLRIMRIARNFRRKAIRGMGKRNRSWAVGRQV